MVDITEITTTKKFETISFKEDPNGEAFRDLFFERSTGQATVRVRLSTRGTAVPPAFIVLGPDEISRLADWLIAQAQNSSREIHDKGLKY
jgi:hypothetical protein